MIILISQFKIKVIQFLLLLILFKVKKKKLNYKLIYVMIKQIVHLDLNVLKVNVLKNYMVFQRKKIIILKLIIFISI